MSKLYHKLEDVLMPIIRGMSLSMVLDLKAIRALQMVPLVLMTGVDSVIVVFQDFG